MELAEYTSKKMTEAQTISIEGVVLESAMKDIVVIIPCFCTQDTKKHPCHCTDMSKLFVSTRDLVGDIVALHKKTADGDLLSRVIVKRDANLLVEQSTSAKAEDAVKIAKSAVNRSFLPPLFPIPPILPCPGTDDPDVMYWLAPFLKYVAPALIGAGGAIVGGWISDDDDCTTRTETTVTENTDGSTTTTTITQKKCS